ncbi:GNAT family N-acetyltransferase [Massilia sp. BSC265]|uniref:GNAT family N-acetyltransferase n=1 Tax=Massilia sp. BSC265 TaxID=1549812 RepID=UPI001E306AEE|nr:GNAT family N-acetyltransferase [Massilia sp. BSC265]
MKTLIHAELVDFDSIKGATQYEHSSALETDSCDNIVNMTINEKSFGIRAADNDNGRSQASLLINKMYAWRGYAGTHRLEEDNPNRISLSASDRGEVVGTVTLGIDSPVGLLADEIFKDQLDHFRDMGGKLCEITKLAFDPRVRSKEALAALFHILFIYGRRIHHCTDVFIEVNPRHRRFYETMLGFSCLGEMRTNPRVNAPAWLLWNNLDKVQEQIERFGGTSSHPGNERSLFPFFFSQKEEEGIARRLMSIG